MRFRHLCLCLLPALLIACSTVRVTEVPKPSGPAQPQVVRGDRAPTADFPPGDSDGYRPPARLAVILPMTGSLAPAGAGVRDGFLAAYYGETRHRPVVKFYDTQGTGGGAQAAVTRALADGAQMIVGPLGRDEVNAVSAGTVPMIVLNRRAAMPGSTSFAMLPEDEGTEAAKRLVSRKLTRVLVFSNRSDNAQRAITSFRTTLREAGGDVVAEIPVVGETTELSTQLAGMLSSPTPPQAILLALEAGAARSIAAQLKTSALAALPRMATSLVLNGGNARTDIELDGIEYPELPWILGQGGNLSAPSTLASLPSARGPSQRLFAFGADAWKLAAFYERLYNDPAFSVPGATGVLSIGIDGPVRRTPSWATFSGGRGRVSDARQPTTDARSATR